MTFTIECPNCGEEMELTAEGAELQEIEDDAGALIACEECKLDTEYDLVEGALVASCQDDEEEDDEGDDQDDDEDDEEE